MSSTSLKTRLSNKLQTTQPESIEEGDNISMPVSNTPATSNTELTPISAEYVALSNNALEVFRENLKSQLTYQLFDTIKSPAGGMTTFNVPGLSGDDVEKELTGIILDYSTPRAYWNTPDPVAGTSPVCHSKDSVVSFDGKSCARCVYNDYGSKDGDTNAKACKEFVAIFLLRPDSVLPIIVRVPVSSKRKFLKYTARLIGGLAPICGVVTKITLEKATSKAGQAYAVYNFEVVRSLSPEEISNVKAFSQRFIEVFTAGDIELQKPNEDVELPKAS